MKNSGRSKEIREGDGVGKGQGRRREERENIEKQTYVEKEKKWGEIMERKLHWGDQIRLFYFKCRVGPLLKLYVSTLRYSVIRID
jgi:hypothetical protein